MSMLRRPGIGSFGGGDGGDDAMAGGGFGVVRVTTHSLVDSSVVFEQTLTAEADEFCIFIRPCLVQKILQNRYCSNFVCL